MMKIKRSESIVCNENVCSWAASSNNNLPFFSSFDEFLSRLPITYRHHCLFGVAFGAGDSLNLVFYPFVNPALHYLNYIQIRLAFINL
jgi:hypothetical protein